MPYKNEPLLLRPAGKDYLWGGSRLNDEFEKKLEAMENIIRIRIL